jgi:hypothetical protein
MKRILYALSHHKFHFVCVRLLGLALKAIFALADPLVMKLLIDEGLIKRNLRLFGCSQRWSSCSARRRACDPPSRDYRRNERIT